MPYFTVTDFAAGLDLRRASHTAPAGTLRKLVNMHVTPGGEIEKRFAFKRFATLPADSRGIMELTCTQPAPSVTLITGLYTFRPGGTGVAGTANRVDRVVPGDPSTTWLVGEIKLPISAIYDVIDYDVFAGRVFAIVWDNTPAHVETRFWDQAAITDPNCHGNFCRTYKSKIFTAAGRKLYSSAVNNPDIWTDTPLVPPPDPALPVYAGAGEVDLGLQDSDMTDTLALEVYFDKMAIMSKTATQLWMLDSDISKYQYVQTLRSAGTVAWRSVLQYASGDVVYLAPDGIRSLRAINSSLMASASDLGSPIDPLLQEFARIKGEEHMAQGIAIIQPVTGRLWMIIKDRIFVLSAFPGPKISAWSEYIPTWEDSGGGQHAFSIVAACTYKNTVIVRDTENNLYAYGGTTEGGARQGVFDRCPVEIGFPYLAGENPATEKAYEGIDAACEGDFAVYASYIPTQNPIDTPLVLDPEDYLGVINGPSFESGRFPMEGKSTHVSLRLRSGQFVYDEDNNVVNILPGTPGRKVLSNMIIHYKLGEAS